MQAIDETGFAGGACSKRSVCTLGMIASEGYLVKSKHEESFRLGSENDERVEVGEGTRGDNRLNRADMGRSMLRPYGCGTSELQ